MLSPRNARDVRVLLLDPLPLKSINAFASASFHVEECFEKLSESRICFVHLLLELCSKISEYNIVCLLQREEIYLTDEVLKSAHRLMAIGVFGRTADCVDISTARTMGIPIFTSPYQHQHSVAELIIASMILLARQTGIPFEIHQKVIVLVKFIREFGTRSQRIVMKFETRHWESLVMVM
jgi:D-3-phosphoglycerate dehydrogenase